MKKTILLLSIVAVSIYAAATRTLYYETWTSRKSNQDLSIAPLGTGVLQLSSDLLMSGTGQIDIPSGTSAQRSSSPNTGMFRFNTDLVAFEGYNGSAWASVGGGAGTKDIFFQEDFEGASVSYTCGANVSTSNAATPLHESKSTTVTQITGSLGQFCESNPINLDPKQKGVPVTLCVTGFGSNWDLELYDVTNTTILNSTTFSSTIGNNCITANTSTGTNQISYRFKVSTELNGDELQVDDIALNTYFVVGSNFTDSFGVQYCNVVDQKPQGTNGGSSVTAARVTRDLNTTSGSCAFLSLTSNQLVFASGTYVFNCYSIAFRTNSTRAYFTNVTSGIDVAQGGAVFPANSPALAMNVKVNGIFSSNGIDTYELQNYTATALASTGLGFSFNISGEPEVYSQCQFYKVQ